MESVIRLNGQSKGILETYGSTPNAAIRAMSIRIITYEKEIKTYKEVIDKLQTVTKQVPGTVSSMTIPQFQVMLSTTVTNCYMSNPTTPGFTTTKPKPKLSFTDDTPRDKDGNEIL